MLNSGDVVDVDLGIPAGTEAGFGRPAVVVTAQRVIEAGSSVVHVVPLTSRVRGHGSEIGLEADPLNGLDGRSAAQCQHIRAVAAARIGTRRGNVGAAALAQIREVLGLLLDTPS
ncbi:type II toxin-antitoxin system PemK/MazF family toxin [Candidatus Poriferisodalis sp.]|uniref:type II toxin-antitoxin system PemK/MazF family toxin n=1 Tax=Candidatus Poriferisodalis sp. TaxID=3101277 RepID=UPI003B01DF9F